MNEELKQKIIDCDKNLIFLEDEVMKNHTSFKVGGSAKYLLIPSSVDRLISIIGILKNSDTKYLIIGKGTNLVVSDAGLDGVVIKTTDLTNVDYKNDIIIAEAGASLAKVAAFAAEKGLCGLEFASGIPGTLGGAVFMNAGAYDAEMKDSIGYTDYIDLTGKLKRIEGENHEFSYRSSVFQKNKGIILRSGIKLEVGDIATIKEKMLTLNKKRKDKQPLEIQCAGSVFKRPEGSFAGKLIEEAGLSGYRIGGAVVSPKHCGFIVNDNNATAKDIIDLIEHVEYTVRTKFGIILEREVRIITEI